MRHERSYETQKSSGNLLVTSVELVDKRGNLIGLLALAQEIQLAQFIAECDVLCRRCTEVFGKTKALFTTSTLRPK